MGCSYDFACKTCKKSYFLGSGSYSTWMTYRSLDEFNEGLDGVKTKSLGKNERIRACLTEHAGHDYEYVLWDICSARGGVLYSETGSYGALEVFLPDWGEYEKIDLCSVEG
jgi:hypothetical protein